MLRGWHGIRESWRRCGWAGCAEPLATQFSHLCLGHIREDDRLAALFKLAQLCFDFGAQVEQVAVLPFRPLPQYQTAFEMPRPRLKGSRKPLPETDQLRKKTRGEIERDEWNRLKRRMLDKRDIKKAQAGNRARNVAHNKQIDADLEAEGW